MKRKGMMGREGGEGRGGERGQASLIHPLPRGRD